MYLQSVLDQDVDQQQPALDANQDASQSKGLRSSNGSAALPPQAVDTQTNAYAKLKALVRVTHATQRDLCCIITCASRHD